LIRSLILISHTLLIAHRDPKPEHRPQDNDPLLPKNEKPRTARTLARGLFRAGSQYRLFRSQLKPIANGRSSSSPLFPGAQLVRLNLASLLQPHKFDLRESHRKRRRPALIIQITAGCLSWNFKPRVESELDASGGLFWTRMTANSRVEQFKALAYDAFRDARFKFRRCPECKRPFVPVGARPIAVNDKNTQQAGSSARRTPMLAGHNRATSWFEANVPTRVSNSRSKSISYANIPARIDFDQDHFYQPPHSVNQVAVKIISSANSVKDWFASD
jgi:hypothetical protein